MTSIFDNKVVRIGLWLGFAALLLAIVWVAGRATPLAQVLGAVSITIIVG